MIGIFDRLAKRIRPGAVAVDCGVTTNALTPREINDWTSLSCFSSLFSAPTTTSSTPSVSAVCFAKSTARTQNTLSRVGTDTPILMFSAACAGEPAVIKKVAIPRLSPLKTTGESRPGEKKFIIAVFRWVMPRPGWANGFGEERHRSRQRTDQQYQS